MELEKQFKTILNFLNKVEEKEKDILLSLVDIYINNMDEHIVIRFVIINNDDLDQDVVMDYLEKLEQFSMVVTFEFNDDEVTFYLTW